MAFLYRFTQYNDPGFSQSGGIRAEWFYTSDVAPFVDQEGNRYEPAILSHDAISLSQEKSSGQVYAKSKRDFAIAQLFRAGTPYGALWAEVRDMETGDFAYVGTVQSTKFSEFEAKLLLAPAAEMLNREGLRWYWQGSCGWALYSQECGVVQDEQDESGAYRWRTNGAVASVSPDGLTVTSPAFATRPNGFFEAGKILVNGVLRTVSSHAGDSIVMLTRVDGLAEGAAFTAYKGCNRSTETGGCSDFNNVVNFQGTPNVKRKNIFVSGIE